MERGAETVLTDCDCWFEELEDQTVWAVAAAAVEEDVSEDEDFGTTEEWARKAARKFERNGRLLVMAASSWPYSRWRLGLVSCFEQSDRPLCSLKDVMWTVWLSSATALCREPRVRQRARRRESSPVSV